MGEIDAPKSIHAWAAYRRPIAIARSRRPSFVPCTVREPWIMWGAATRVDPIVVAPPGVVLLWSLACEMDDRGATLTGDRVCRACGGSGWTNVWGIGDGIPVRPGAHEMCHVYYDWSGNVIDPRSPESWSAPTYEVRWRRTDPCACTGTTRPDTISLAWLVAHLAAQRSPIVNDWPDQWRVNRDQADATGDDSWQAQWWRAFEIWVTAGIAPGADDLAGLLGALTPERSRIDPWPPLAGSADDASRAIMDYRKAVEIMSGTMEESIVLDAVIDPGLQELEVRAEAWEHEDVQRDWALLDLARIARDTVTASEVRAQRFMDDDG